MSAKLKKLRHMPLAEISSRSRELLFHVNERVRYSTGMNKQFGFAATGDDLLKSCQNLVPGTRLFSHDDLIHDSLIVQEEASLVRKTSNLLQSGSVNLLGVDFAFCPAQWNLDPTTEYAFDDKFYGDVVTHQHGGNEIDVKYPWELSRHQYLVPLAQSWLTDCDTASASLVQKTIMDWIHKNPVNHGVNWTSALEVAIRCISWVWCLGCTHAWSGWTEASLEPLRQSMAQHANYLYHRLSEYSSPYNHLIGECAALYLLSHALSNCSDSDAWRAKATNTLNSRISSQFYEDGFTLEQSTSYHYFTLGFACIAESAAQISGDTQLRLADWIGKAAKTGLSFQSRPGNWCRIGDSDSARSIPTAYHEYWDFGGVSTLASALCSNVPLPLVPRYGETLWMLGSEGLKATEHASQPMPPSENLLPQSGYATMRSNSGDWLCLDGGPIADGLFKDNTPSTAHGHLDALQLLATIKGRSVLVDSGVPYYFKNSECLDYFRGPEAHNTLSFDGFPLAKRCGTLMWNQVAYTCHIEPADVFENGWGVCASMQFEKLTSAVVRRYVGWRDDVGLIVIDEVPALLSQAARWHWHFAEETDAVIEQGRLLLGDYLFCGGSSQGEVTLAPAANDGPDTCLSAGYGQRARHIHLSSQCKHHRNADLPFRVAHAVLKSNVRIVVAELSSGSSRISLGADNAKDIIEIGFPVSTGERS